MTDRLTALRELLAKVEAGRGAEYRGPYWHELFGSHKLSQHFADAYYNGSLDAAKALHEAVLPNQGWGVNWIAQYPHLMGGGRPYHAEVGWGTMTVGRADTPARAWLIAILRALIAQEEGK